MLIRERREFQISPLDSGDNDDKRYEKAALLLLAGCAPGLNLCLHSSSCPQVIIISILLFKIIMISCTTYDRDSERISIMIMMPTSYLSLLILKQTHTYVLISQKIDAQFVYYSCNILFSSCAHYFLRMKENRNSRLF